MLSHDVFFTLRDPSPDAIQALLQSCYANLRDHEGVLYFSAGVLEADLDRPVNDQAFHVALHVTFSDRAAHDLYQVAPEHQVFIEQNEANWAQVRVFDSSVNGGAGRSD